MKTSILIITAFSFVIAAPVQAQTWGEQQQMYNQRANLEAELFIQREEMEQQQEENRKAIEEQREAIQDQQEAIEEQRRELKALSGSQDDYTDY